LEYKLEYGANGDSVSDGRRMFVYDYKGRLRELYVDGVLKARYIYDAKQRRIAKLLYEPDGVTIERIVYFVYDGWQVVEEYEAVKTDDIPPTLNSPIRLVADYVYGIGIDEPLRMRRDLNRNTIFENDESFYYHENGIGSIYAVTDTNGNVIERYDYTTYGVTQIYEPDGITERVVSSIDNPYTFHARRLDSETETGNYPALIYYRHRTYNPHLQRFLQKEKALAKGTPLHYSFCRDNPTSFVDPYGLEEQPPKGVTLKQYKAEVEKVYRESLEALEANYQQAGSVS